MWIEAYHKSVNQLCTPSPNGLLKDGISGFTADLHPQSCQQCVLYARWEYFTMLGIQNWQTFARFITKLKIVTTISSIDKKVPPWDISKLVKIPTF